MRRRTIGLIGLASTFLLGCLHAPVVWSPDGRWLAYTTAIRPEPEGLAPGWIFELGEGVEKDLAGNEPTRRPSAVAYRLWATRPDTGSSVLLEESRGPLTSPCWSPDGKSLSFGRLVPEENGRARFEVVIQDAPDRKRILFKQPYSEFSAKSADLPGLTLAWSPDGRYLAVPLFQQTLGLGILRADNGRLLKVVEDAYLPSWSPDGTKLAFLHGSDAEALYCLDTNFGPPRHLADIGQASQAPIWSRDKRTIVIVARRKGTPAIDPQAPPPELVRGAPAIDPQALKTDLIRVPVDGGKVEALTLDSEAADRDRASQGVSFSLDPEGESLFFAIVGEGTQSEVTWFRPRNREYREKFNPIDHSVKIGSLAISPNGKTLAFRAGEPGYFAPPGLRDLATKQFTAIVPDDSARVEWVLTLVRGARRVLRGALPPAIGAKGHPIERASVLPIPGEIAANSEAALRLRRLGRMGRVLCDRPLGSAVASASTANLLDEARLFFDYLSEDYSAALSSLEALELRMSEPEQRLRLLSIRAQIFMGQKKLEQSEDAIAYLQSIEHASPIRFESTPAGPSLTEEVPPSQGWPNYLSARAKEWARSSPAGNLEQGNMPLSDPPELPAAAMAPFMPANPNELQKDEIPALVREFVPRQEGDARLPRRLVPIPPRFQRPAPGVQRPGPPPRPSTSRKAAR